MTTAHLPRTLLVAAALLLACPGEQKKGEGLPPAKGGAVAAPVIPGPPAAPPPGQSVAAAAAIANRYVATALPKHMAELGPKMSGTLSAVMVEEGERVKKGQALFRLNTQSIQLNVAQAETALSGAKIARDNAERELERQRQLAAKGTISAAVLERSESAFNSATNGVSQAEVAVSMARRGNTDSTVYSPIDGIVARKLKSVGETVTMMPPTTVVVVQDQSTIELRTRVPETALTTIREGEVVVAHFSSVNISREAKIVRIQPTVDPMTRTIEIVADVANQDNALRPGMYVELELAPPTYPPGMDPAGAKVEADAADGDGKAAKPAKPTKAPVATAKPKKPASPKDAP